MLLAGCKGAKMRKYGPSAHKDSFTRRKMLQVTFAAGALGVALRPSPNVRRPDLVGPAHAQPAQQIGVNLVPLRSLAGIGLSASADLLLVEDQQTANRSLRQCPNFRE